MTKKKNKWSVHEKLKFLTSILIQQKRKVSYIRRKVLSQKSQIVVIVPNEEEIHNKSWVGNENNEVKLTKLRERYEGAVTNNELTVR